MNSPYLHKIFTNWLDLIEIFTHVKDKKYISYKILDFCLALNHGKFTCFSTVNNEFVQRGNGNEKAKQLHQKAASDLRKKETSKLWIEQNCIHFYLDFGLRPYAFFTVEFDEHANLNQMLYILDIMLSVFFKKEKDSTLGCESIFQLLQTSMKEMNNHQYYLSYLSIKFMEKIVELLPISNESYKQLLNICKVFPYGFDFLQKNIANTREWDLLQDLKNYLLDEVNKEELKIECKILLFIYKVIIHGESKDSVGFKSVELNEIFMKAYDKALKSAEQVSNIKGNEHKPLEEMNDLQNIISTLSLTPREKEILYLILEGLNNQEVGDYLKISVHTVKNHVTNIFKKLNVSDRIQAMAKIYRIKADEVMKHA